MRAKAGRPFGPVTVAKAYRLLHAILNTAADDGLIRRNPCRIKGAGQEDSAERAVIPIAHAARAARRGAAAISGARPAGDVRQPAVRRAGRAAARPGRPGRLRRPRRRPRPRLGRRRADRRRPEVAGRPAHASRSRRRSPRSCAGTWSASPRPATTASSSSARRAAGCAGQLPRRSGPRPANAAGLPDLHFHDLRHTGTRWRRRQGATLRELMERMGHSSSRAALIYQHATQERDEAIAAGMGKLLRQARRKAKTAARERARISDRARNGHAAGNAPPEDRLETDDHAPDLGRNSKSGRRESNPHDQLGRLGLYH